MQRWRTSLDRRLVPLGLAAALLVLAVISGSGILGVQDQLRVKVSEQLEDQLRDRVEAWEDNFLELLDEWIQDVGEQQTLLERRQMELRYRVKWFDSFYIWNIAPSVATRPESARASYMTFPTLTVPEDTLWASVHPCLRRAKFQSLTSASSPQQTAVAIMQMCANQRPSVRLAAAGEAAGAIANSGDTAGALNLLEGTGITPSVSLRKGMAKGISPYRLVQHRKLYADLLILGGQEAKALDQMLQTAFEIAELNAPDAASVADFLPVIMKVFVERSRKEDARLVEEALHGVNRRIRAWEEVANRIIPETNQPSSSFTRFVLDQYRQDPYLLYYGSTATGKRGTALQMDQSKVIANFLRVNRRYGKPLIITDASGSWVAGPKLPTSDLEIQVPFGKTLTHLRVSLSTESVEASMVGLKDQWIVPLVITGICVLLGFLALSAQLTANRRLQELVRRQREFTTRVTHELKTPIAGIRILAENLEMGVYSTPEQRVDMARRIVSESDRLTQRVDEVLAIAQTRRLPAAIPFEVDEPIFEAVEIWGPRFEQHKIHFQVDIGEAPEINGYPDEVRDAVGCLLDNALKYRDPQTERPVVQLSLENENGWAIIEISDNGLGVPPKQRTQIFERFHRVEGPHRGLAGGHGLGLTQVAEVAKIHRGTVACLPNTPSGTCFVLRLQGVK